ncbi:MAG: FtsH protease activity modulator HflK [Candidatus Tectomicrobia bacterium]|uniref:Protein HflK n=1 Tax=Tectimicrobiota bacterium TaxID=2528274 RepID=A0A932MMM7_UNCTE|nr:FtsH protease activity modulator HflK [Candidatus Tectomicrobia bacterium]
MPMDWDEFKARRQSGGGLPPQIRMPQFQIPSFRNIRLPWALLAAGVAALWLLSGIFTVGPDEQGVVLRFGRIERVVSPGLNYHFPFPFETVYKPKVTEVKRIEIGFRTIDPGPPARYQDHPEESRMLTGDENMLDVNVIIQFRIKDPLEYLFKVRNPDRTVRLAAEAALRQVVGNKPIDEALTTGKGAIQQETMETLQAILNRYQSGLTVVAVQLQDVNPPKDVSEAFRDVASAREDKNRLINEAQGYRNKVIPEARGRVAEIVERATAYRETKIRQARGDAGRFLATLEEYKKAPDITRTRLHLEMLQEVMPSVDKVILEKQGSGVLPILPLRDGAKEMKP